MEKIASSDKRAIKMLMETSKKDVRSVTGQNFRNIMVLVGKTSVDEVVKDDAESIKYHPIDKGDLWKVDAIKEIPFLVSDLEKSYQDRSYVGINRNNRLQEEMFGEKVEVQGTGFWSKMLKNKRPKGKQSPGLKRQDQVFTADHPKADLEGSDSVIRIKYPRQHLSESKNKDAFIKNTHVHEQIKSRGRNSFPVTGGIKVGDYNKVDSYWEQLGLDIHR